LILAQDERWRRGLGMQVERSTSVESGKRVRNTLVTYPEVRDNLSKDGLIPDVLFQHKLAQ